MSNNKSVNFLLFVIIIILLSGGLFCFFVGQKIEISSQIGIYKSLRDVSVVIFAILGVWIAVVSPDILRRIYRDGASTENAKKELNKVKLLSVPMFIAASCFCVIIIMEFLYPALRTVCFLVSNKIFVRMISYLFLYLILIVQVWSLFVAILPILGFWDMLKTYIIKTENKKMYQKNIG